MRRRIYSKTVVAVFAMLSIIGLVGSVGATPDGSQRLRGLGDRVFFVQVQDLFAEPGSEEEFFDNCYLFLADGTWIDPPFPVTGHWNQNSNGAKTSYMAAAVAENFEINVGTEENPILFPVTVVLDQQGEVTPAGGKGVLQLWAFSQVIIVEFGDLVVGEFVSIGYEVDECPL